MRDKQTTEPILLKEWLVKFFAGLIMGTIFICIIFWAASGCAHKQQTAPPTTPDISKPTLKNVSLDVKNTKDYKELQALAEHIYRIGAALEDKLIQTTHELHQTKRMLKSAQDELYAYENPK